MIAPLFWSTGGVNDDAQTAEPVVVDLTAAIAADTGASDGAIWSLPHDGDLDTNLVVLGPRGTIEAHVNGEVDVLVVVHAGGGKLRVDGVSHELRPGMLALVRKGSERGIVADTEGVSYLSIHRRRGGVTIGSR